MQISLGTIDLKKQISTSYWLLFCVIFSVFYILNNRVGPDSSLLLHAQLKISPPFVFRLLIPWTLNQVLPGEWLDLNATRSIIAAAFSWASILLMPAFVERIIDRPLIAEEKRRLQISIFIVLIAHYLLPRNFKFYYIYDIPAIPFYQITFLCLTDRRTWACWLGVAAAAIFALNRETIGVAVVHAGAWHFIKSRNSENLKFSQSLPPLILATLCILFTRWSISHAINIPPQSSFSWMDGDQIRLFANLKRIVTKHHHAFAVLWFGAGAFFWLPNRWTYFDDTLKSLLIASMPVFLFFCVVGNFVELRMFSELVPLLAASLAWPMRKTAS
jgi:hypothetical protein